MLDSLPSLDEEDTPHKTGVHGEDGEEIEQPESNLPLEEEDVDKIVACLEEIYRLLAHPQDLIVSIGNPKIYLFIGFLN